MAALRGEVAQATERAEVGESNLAELKGRVCELAQDVHRLSDENEALAAEKEKLESQLSLERDAFGRHGGHLQSENARLVVAEKTLKLANEQLSSQLNATSQALEQSRVHCTTLQSRNAATARERDALAARKAIIDTNVSELTAELKETKNMLGDYQGRHAASKDRNKVLSDENDRVILELDVAKQQIARLWTKIDTRRDFYDGLARDKDSLADKVAQLQKDLADRDRKLGDALVWSSDMLTEIGSLKEQSTKLERVMRMSRQSLEQGRQEDRLRAGFRILLRA